MQLEFHQLERRWEHLRLREPHRQRQLTASLAESGQQTPIIVVQAENDSDRYVVIDGYKRIAALDSTAGAGRQNCGTNSDEVSGAGSAAQRGGLRADGRSLCPAPL
jgi:ParB-like nuclease domain